MAGSRVPWSKLKRILAFRIKAIQSVQNSSSAKSLHNSSGSWTSLKEKAGHLRLCEYSAYPGTVFTVGSFLLGAHLRLCEYSAWIDWIFTVGSFLLGAHIPLQMSREYMLPLSGTLMSPTNRLPLKLFHLGVLDLGSKVDGLCRYCLVSSV